MKEIIEDIRGKIANKCYQNEEQIRLDIIIRLLKVLGWDIWNPEEVYLEYPVSPTEDRTRIDIALFPDKQPSVFIEVKYLGLVEAKLAQIEQQLRNYNKDNTAIISIITDGILWRFYFAYARGEFSQKCFKIIDFVNDDIEDVELYLTAFLNKQEIKNGSAIEEAKKYLELSQKQKILESSMPQARRLIQEPPFPNLPDALVKIARENGINIERNEALKYIEKAKTKRNDIAERTNIIPQKEQIKQRTINPITDFRFAKIIKAEVGNESAKSWNELIRIALKYALNKTNDNVSEVRRITNLNIVSGIQTNKGFNPIKGKKFSFQDVPASKAIENLRILSDKFDIHYKVEFEWGEKSPNFGRVEKIQSKF